MYQYLSSGLSNIWLKNGYKVHNTAYGEGISIDNLEDLHQSIAMTLIRTPTKMTGDEFRFLRKELNLSQKKLADMMGVEDQTIANWEKKQPTSLAERTMRLISIAHYTDSGFQELVKALAELDRQEHEDLYFEESDNGWQTTAA